ncbi:MAG: transglutaminase domain-containing protein [Bacillota bacterium]
MLKKLIAVGVFCAVFLTQVLMGVADAAPKMAQNESVVQEGLVPQAAAGSSMQTAKSTYLYAKGTKNSSKLLKLGAGTKVTVKKNGKTWIQVSVSGKTGYVNGAYLKTSGSTPKSAAAVALKAGSVMQTTASTGVYAKATKNSTKILSLSTGNKVTVKKDGKTWAMIAASGKTGYINRGYLTASKSSASSSTTSTTSTKVPTSSTSKAEIYTDQVANNVIKIKLISHNGKKLKAMIAKGSQTAYYNLLATTGYQTFPLNMGTGTYKVSALENISGTSYKYIASKSVTVSSTSTSAYLISTSEVNFNASMAPIKLAASLANGKTESQKVQAIYNWVVNNIDYDRYKNPPAGYVPSIVNTYNTRKGICYDFAALFAAMLRSQGVPTKLVKGYADNVNGYHAWNEVYISGKWYTVDTSYDAQVKGSMYKYSGYHKTSES